MSFDAGSIESTLELDTSPFKAGLEWARREAAKGVRVAVAVDDKGLAITQAQLDKLGATKVTPKVDVDDKKATVKVGLLAGLLGGLAARVFTPRADLDISGAVAKASLLNKVLDFGGLGGRVQSAGGLAFKGGGIVSGLLAVTAAALPAAAALGGVGVAGAVGMAAAGVAVTLATKVIGADMKTIQDATKKGLNLTGPAGLAQKALAGVSKSWKDVQKATSGPVFGLLTDTFQTVQGILPRLVPLIKTVANGLDGVVYRLFQFSQSKTFGTLLTDLRSFAKGFTATLGPVLVTFLSAFAKGFHALSPLFKVVGNGILGIAQNVERFAGGPGMKNFVKLAVDNLPKVSKLIGAALGLVGSLMTSLGPLSGPALKFITNLLGGLSKLNLAPLAKGFGAMLNALAPIIPVAVSFLNVILKPLGALLGALAHGPVHDLVQSLGTGLAPAFKIIGSVLGTLVKPLSQFLGSIANLVNPTGVKLVVALLGSFAGIIKQVAPPVLKLASALESVIDNGIEMLIPYIPKLTGPLKSLATMVTGQLLPAIGKMVHGFDGSKGVFSDLAKPGGPLFMLGGFLFTVAKTAIVVATGLAEILSHKAIVEMVLGVVAAIKAWAIVQAALNFLLTANPLGLVVAGLALLVGGLVYAYNHSKTFHAIVVGAFNAVKAAGIAVGHFVVTACHDIAAAAVWVAHQVVRAFDWVVNACHDVKKWFSDLGHWISATWSKMIGTAIGWVKDRWSDFANGLKSIYNKVIKPIWGVFKSALGDLKGAFQTAVDGIRTIWAGIKSAAADPVRFIVNTVLNDGLIAGFNSISHAIAGDNGPTIPRIPGFRVGSARTPGRPEDIAGVAHGDEAIIPSAKRRSLEAAAPGALAHLVQTGLWPTLKTGNSANQNDDHGTNVPAYIKGVPVNLHRLMASGPHSQDGLGRGGYSAGQAVHQGESMIGQSGWFDRCLAFVNAAWGHTVGRFGLATARDSANAGPLNKKGTPPAGAAAYYSTGSAGHVTLAVGDGTEVSNDIVQPGRLDRVPHSAFATKWNAPFMGWWSPTGAKGGSGTADGGPSVLDYLSMIKKKITGAYDSIAGGLGAAAGSPYGKMLTALPHKVGDMAVHGIETLAKKTIGLAGGTGNAAPGWTPVNERGFEMIKFRGGEKVLTHEQTKRELSQGGPTDAAMLDLLRQIVAYLAGQPTKEDQQALLDGLARMGSSNAKAMLQAARAA